MARSRMKISGSHATKALADAFARDRPAEPADPYERLTDREREVFQLVVEGKTITRRKAA